MELHPGQIITVPFSRPRQRLRSLRPVRATTGWKPCCGTATTNTFPKISALHNWLKSSLFTIDDVRKIASAEGVDLKTALGQGGVYSGSAVMAEAGKPKPEQGQLFE